VYFLPHGGSWSGWSYFVSVHEVTFSVYESMWLYWVCDCMCTWVTVCVRVYCTECFMCFFTKSLLFTTKLSSFDTLLIGSFLSLCSLVQSYIRWSTFWFSASQDNSGECIILRRCRYDLVLPWDVTITVNFVINLIFVVNLSFMTGKNCYVVDPFVVWSHSIYHLDMLWSRNSWTIALLGNLW
jgi:hypothetical protein